MDERMNPLFNGQPGKYDDPQAQAYANYLHRMLGREFARELSRKPLFPSSFRKLKWWEPSWYLLLRLARRAKGAWLVLVGRADWEYP